MKKQPSRDDELCNKAGVREKLLDIYKDVEKGFENQRDRADNNLDNWDLYNCILGQRQFYNGTSQIFAPFIKDAIKARKTRFTNQIFPQTGRYVEVTTGDADLPQGTMALLETYVRRTKLRTQIVPALLVNGDIEGQWTVYASWEKLTRNSAQRIEQKVVVAGYETDAIEPITTIEEEEVSEEGPTVEVIHDADICVLPSNADSIEQAFADGGSVTILRRWTKGRIKRAIDDGEIDEEEGDTLIESMSSASRDKDKNIPKKLADAAGIKSGGGGKFALIYETWTNVKVDGKRQMVRVYFGGEERVLSCKRNPYWCDLCPVISGPVDKLAGVFKGKPPVNDAADFQIFANDTINEGADTAHFSAMPIVMTDPEKNPRTETMVLGLAAVWKTDPKSTSFAQFPDLWRSALDRAGALKEQIFQTLGVNPAMIPQGSNKKMNQAEVANQQQVDLLTTSDVVTNLEEQILTPLIQRFAYLDHQFRDKPTTVRVYGEMGLRANMEEVEPIQLNKRYEFRWLGVESARNAAQIQQQIAGLNVLKGIPPQMYPNYDFDISPALVQMVENTFGPRIGPLIFKPKQVISVPIETENAMLLHGFKVPVHPSDDDIAHIQGHMALITPNAPPGHIQEHIVEHSKQIQAKALAQQGAPKGQPGTPGGAGPGAAGAPRPGAQPAAPRQLKGPEGMIAPDQMPAAGSVPMPRKM